MNLEALKKTIPFKWRVQSCDKKEPPQVSMIAYVDARDVAEHLDSIIGAENWCDTYQEIKGRIYCSIGIKCGGEWVFKSDVGTESNTEKEKGESSDAFKRAAVKWGINRDAYRVGIVKLPAKMYGKTYYPISDKGKFLKGQELFDLCNSLAKVEDLDNYDIDTTEIDVMDIIALFERKKPELPDSMIIRINEIIETKEEKSYKKVLSHLQGL
jgi:hypothetical protein